MSFSMFDGWWIDDLLSIFVGILMLYLYTGKIKIYKIIIIFCRVPAVSVSSIFQNCRVPCPCPCLCFLANIDRRKLYWMIWIGLRYCQIKLGCGKIVRSSRKLCQFWFIFCFLYFLCQFWFIFVFCTFIWKIYLVYVIVVTVVILFSFLALLLIDTKQVLMPVLFPS